MSASYEVWLCSDVGERLALLDSWSKLEYAKAVNRAGAFSLDLAAATVPAELLQRDRQIQVWRRPSGGVLGLDFLGFLRYWRHEFDNGAYTMRLAGHDPNGLLARRIVAYPAGDAFATINGGAADDGLKDVFDENFLATATDADREWQANGLSVAANDSAAAGVTMGYAWRDVPRVLDDISKAAMSGGEVFYRLEIAGVDATTGLVSLEFRTAVGLPGEDHTWDSAHPVVFGPEQGNVAKAWLEYDYREEVTFVYAGGQGEGSDRVIATASDTDRLNASVWGRIEAFRDARNESDTDAVQAAADAALEAGRPELRFGMDVLDTEYARYGRDWGMGDMVTAQAFGAQVDALVRSVQVRVDAKGQETIVARLSNEETT